MRSFLLILAVVVIAQGPQNVAPGKYKLSVDYTCAGYTISVTGVVLSLGGRPLYVPETWAKTYFPGTPDPDRAAIVEFGESASVERLDFGISSRQ